MPGSDVAVPTQRGSCVGIAAAEVGIPGTGHTVGVVLPVHTPAADRTGIGIVDGNCTGVAGVPLVADAVGTGCRLGCRAKGRCRHAETQHGRQAVALSC